MPSYRIELRGKSLNMVYTHLKDQRIPIKIKCKPDQFQDKEGNWVKGDPLTNLAIEAKLNEIKEYVKKFYLEYSEYPAPEQMAGFFVRRPKEYAKMKFQQLWEEFMKYKTSQGDFSVGDSRYKHYNTTLNMLLKYKPLLHVRDMNLSFYHSLKEYFKNKMEYSKNTQTTHVKIIKSFMKWACAKGVLDYEDLLMGEMKDKFTTREIIYHPIEELRAMMHEDLEFWPEVAYVRDVYVLQCFIGVRVSDLFGSGWEIGENFLRKIAIKTENSSEEEIVIPLRSEAKGIIKRIMSSGKIEVNISDVEYNRKIKTVGHLCGIKQPVMMVKGKRQFKRGQSYPKNELMSSHVARATFICQMVELDVQTEKIMKMTGIKNHKTIKNYATVIDKTLTDTMLRVERMQASM